MIVNALAVIGFLWLCAKANRLVHWYFRVDRSGKSRRHTHWSIER